MSERTLEPKEAENRAWDIPLALIDPSPYNRTRFDEGKLNELAGSLKLHGQLDDALVRPKAGGRYELVAGERRWRACPLAGFVSLRAKIKEMTDNEAHELVLVEQLQHEEWSVVEEARGFASLMSLKDGDGAPLYTLEKCAVRIDKSENYIRELLAILDAPQELQAAVERGELAKASAAVVASIPDPEQRELAGKMVLRPANKTSGPLSVLETKELIKDRFARSLQGAPFKQADALLVPVMNDVAGARVMGGACSDCPFRAGNMPAFKDDLAVSGGRGGAGGQSGINPNLCTQPKCFSKKCEAVAEAVRKEALSRGCELLDADQAKKLFGEDGKLKDSSGYVDIESKVDPTLFNHFDAAKVPTWKAIIKKHGKGKGITVWLAQAPSGAFVELVKWEEAVALVNKETEPPASEGDPVFPPMPEFSDDPPKEPTPEAPRTTWDEGAAKEANRLAREVAATKERRTLEFMAKLRVALRVAVAKQDKDMASILVVDAAERVAGPDAMKLLRKLPGVKVELDNLEDEFGLSEWPDYIALVIMMFLGRCMSQWGPGWQGWEDWGDALGVRFETDPVIAPDEALGLELSGESKAERAALDSQLMLIARAANPADSIKWLNDVVRDNAIFVDPEYVLSLEGTRALLDAAMEAARLQGVVIPSGAVVGGEGALRAELIAEIRSLAEQAEGAEYPDLVQGWIDAVARDSGLKSTSDESATMDDLQALLLRANEELKSLESKDVPADGSDKVVDEPLRGTSDFHLVSASVAGSPAGSDNVVVLDEIKSEVQPELDIASGGNGCFMRAHVAIEAARKVVKKKSKIAAKKAVAKKVAKPAKKSAVKKVGKKKGGASK